MSAILRQAIGKPSPAPEAPKAPPKNGRKPGHLPIKKTRSDGVSQKFWKKG